METETVEAERYTRSELLVLGTAIWCSSAGLATWIFEDGLESVRKVEGVVEDDILCCVVLFQSIMIETFRSACCLFYRWTAATERG